MIKKNTHTKKKVAGNGLIVPFTYTKVKKISEIFKITIIKAYYASIFLSE